MSLSEKCPSRDRHRGRDKRGMGGTCSAPSTAFLKCVLASCHVVKTLGCLIHSYVLSEFSFRNVRTDVTAGKEGGAGGHRGMVCSNRGSRALLCQDPHNFLRGGKKAPPWLYMAEWDPRYHLHWECAQLDDGTQGPPSSLLMEAELCR